MSPKKDSGGSLRLYNTLTKAEEPVGISTDQPVTMYTCGPTVYGRPHIGNLSAFLMADLLRRWLEVRGFTVTHVKNITDVGHLVRDADEGEDKIEKQAREEKGSATYDSVIAIARTYEEQYLEDERALNMVEPESRPRASEHIDAMKAMIDDLLRKGIAYVTDDGIYFDVAQCPHYGKLSGNTLDQLNAGARIDVNERKRHPADFALWKFCVGANEHHVLRWPSPGEGHPDGFPGWHIECSAMARQLLGDSIDIHTGGEDNIFPHHECEIAQSESVTGKKPFARLWLHRRRIDLEGEKMSKSLGNTVTLPDILARGYGAQDVRYYLLSVHYRTNLKFSWKGMDDAKKARGRVAEWMEECMDSLPEVRGREAGFKPQASSLELTAFQERFTHAMNDDLNTPGALAAVFDCMAWSRNRESLPAQDADALRSFMTMVRDTFGCFQPEEQMIAPEALALAKERDEARAKKDFAQSDVLRDRLQEMGYEVRDTAAGTVLRRATHG